MKKYSNEELKITVNSKDLKIFEKRFQKFSASRKQTSITVLNGSVTTVVALKLAILSLIYADSSIKYRHDPIYYRLVVDLILKRSI